MRLGRRARTAKRLRSTPAGYPSFTGMEIEIKNDPDGPPAPRSNTSLYGAVAPLRNVTKPAGEWNTAEISLIGRHLTASLASAYPEAALHTPSIDVRNAEEVATAVREASPDVCVHLAAVSTVRAAEQTEQDAWDINLHGTLRVVR